MPKKLKKNHFDPILLVREVVESASGGPLTPKKPRKKKPLSHKK